MKLLLALLALSLTAHAQEKYIPLGETVALVITDEPCPDDPQMNMAYAVETKLEEFAKGCWTRANGEVYVRLQNGSSLYDYRYYEYQFEDVK